MADSNGNGSNIGTVEQVTGVVVDAVFPDQLPEIYSALRIEVPEGEGRDAIDLTLEFNRERQAAITQEIMEVVAGAESLV